MFQMKAIRVYGPKDIRIEDVPKPVPGPGEVLVKIKYVGICGTDIEIYLGELGYIKQGIARLPMIPGHEWAGTVCELGNDVSKVKIGDKVCGENGLGCGNCEMCLNGQYHLCKEKVAVGIFNKDGAFAEYLVMPQNVVHILPEQISMQEGALVEPACVAYYGIKRIRIDFGDTVLVIGDGIIGQFSSQIAKLSGAATVIMIGSHQEKMEIAKELSADYIVDRHLPDTDDKIMELTNGDGPDVIIESSGNPKALSQSIKLIKKGGRIAVVSHYSQIPNDFDFNRLVSYNVSLFGVVSSPGVWDAVIRMIKAGALKVKPLISGEYPLEKTEEIIVKYMNREIIGTKFLIKV
jgi:L-iditol 2-dehydrogenase